MTVATHRILTIGGAVLLALALSAAIAVAQTGGAPTTAASDVPASGSRNPDIARPLHSPRPTLP
jgi:hypothetical protein